MSANAQKQAIIQDIATSYVESLSQSQITSTIGQGSYRYVSCGTSNQDCQKCIEYVIPPDTLKKQDQSVKDSVNRIARDPTGLCYDVCTCNISDINMQNDVQVNMTSKLVDAGPMMDRIVESIQKSLSEKYNIKAKSADISNIITCVSGESAQDINQILFATQVMNVDGGAYDIKNVSMSMMINTVMSAIQNNSTASSYIDQYVSSYKSKITKSVDSAFSSGFSRVWKQTKSYFYILLGMIAFILFVYIGLVIYTTTHKK